MTLITVNKNALASRYFVILCYAHYKGLTRTKEEVANEHNNINQYIDVRK